MRQLDPGQAEQYAGNGDPDNGVSHGFQQVLQDQLPGVELGSPSVSGLVSHADQDDGQRDHQHAGHQVSDKHPEKASGPISTASTGAPK